MATLVRELYSLQIKTQKFTMNNLIDIQNQIQALQKQADEIKAQEFAKTVQEIQAKMEAFGITVKDLQGSGATVRKSKGKTKSSSPAAAKFRGPNGEVWSGRGLMPRWLSALVAQGKTKEEFAIKS